MPDSKAKPSPAKPPWYRRVLKWTLIIVSVLLVLAGLALLLVDPVVKAVAEKRLTRAIGMKVTIDDIDAGVFRSEVTVTGLRIFYRSEFGGKTLLVLPELHVDYNWDALRRRKVLHLEEMRLHIGWVNLVVNTKGETFFERYKKSISRQKRSESPLKGNPSSPRNEKLRQGFAGIEELKLTLGKLRVTDMRRPGWSEEYGVNLKNAVFRDLRTREDFETMSLQLIAVMGFYTGFEKALERWEQMEDRTPVKSLP